MLYEVITPLRRVIGVGDVLGGKTVADLWLGPHGLGRPDFSTGTQGFGFWAAFADGSEGMFTAEIPAAVPAAGPAGRVALAALLAALAAFALRHLV